MNLRKPRFARLPTPFEALKIGRRKKVALIDLDGVLLLTEGMRRAVAMETAIRKTMKSARIKPDILSNLPEGFYGSLPEFLTKANNFIIRRADGHGKDAPYLDKKTAFEAYFSIHLAPHIGKAKAMKLGAIALRKFGEEREKRTELPSDIPSILGTIKRKGYLPVVFTSRTPKQAVDLLKHFSLDNLFHGVIFAQKLPKEGLESNLPVFGFGLQKDVCLEKITKIHDPKKLVLFDDRLSMVETASRMGVNAYWLDSEQPTSRFGARKFAESLPDSVGVRARKLLQQLKFSRTPRAGA